MAIHLSTAPCCWGVDDVSNPFLPPWEHVLSEAALAGYRGIELGPYGYLPLDVEVLGGALAMNGLNLIAGTIFDNLVDPNNLPSLLRQAHDICALLKPLHNLEKEQEQFVPYLVIIDWGHEARDYAAGHSDQALRLSAFEWSGMMAHIRAIADIAKSYGVRAVIHPHAGGRIEFADELERLVQDIGPEVAGLCLDTGYLHYAGMDPAAMLPLRSPA